MKQNIQTIRDVSKYQHILKKYPILRKAIAFLRLLPRKSVICNGPGFKIRVRSPKTSQIGRSIFFSGMWERKMTSMVQEKIQKGWYILDVGADIGYYSLLFAQKCGPDGTVIAFEPDPEPWPILNYNIDNFELSNIRPFAFALSDHRGHGMMKKAGRGQLYPNQEESGDATSVVELITLDEFWPTLNLNHLDLVKIDVEGAELSVLIGMEKVIQKYHPHLLIEIHPRQLKEIFHSSAEDVIQLITEKYSYKLTPVDTEKIEIPKEGNITVWCDWVKI